MSPDPELAHRRHAVRALLADRGWHAVLVVDPGNIYYLTGLDRVGYFSFTGLLLPLHGDPVLVARTMEEPTVRAQAPDVTFVGYDDTASPAAAVTDALHALGLHEATIGVERTTMHFPPVAYDALTSTTTSTWTDASGTVETISAVKSSTELDHTRHAARLSDHALDRALAVARDGVTEAEIAGEALRALIAGGGDHPGFPPLVRATRRIDLEHVAWSSERLHPDDGLLIELSGCVRRYHAPLTRTSYLRPTSPGHHDAAEIALAALDAAADALHPGATTGDVYAAWQQVIDDALGAGRYRRHNCGHLVGYGYQPGWFGGAHMTGLTPGGTTELTPGMTVHLFSWLTGERSPGDYVVSDTLTIHPDGAEFLTTAPRTLPAVQRRSDNSRHR